MNEDKHTITSGLLEVGAGHQIYYQEWGNKNADPIFFLHGGPGGGTSDKHKLSFDPSIHHVIFHDQRGCGLSLPFGELGHNTTDDLVEDINKIRAKLNISGKIKIYGASWGSTLALAYAVKHPENVSKMLLQGIYTGTKKETDYINQGGGATHFPESWQNYIEVVPKTQRNNCVEYYHKMMTSSDENVSNDHIARWNANEGCMAFIDPNMAKIQLQSKDIDPVTKAIAIFEAHYFVNNCFMEDNYIINNAHKISHIPTILVQGRFDHVCPPITAYNLQKAIGNNCHLQIVTGSHAHESSVRDVLLAYIWSWF